MVKSDKNLFGIVAAIVALALVLRAAWGVAVPVVPISDSRAYDILAHALVEHGAYSWGNNQLTAYWPPGTSAIYAALYWIFGYSFRPVVVLNVILSTAVVGLTMVLAAKLFDKRTGIIAGLLMAVWPSEVAYVTVLASEIPFTFLILLGCTVWFSSWKSNIARAAVSGLAFGAASYFRPIALLLPIIVWLSTLLDWRKLRAGIPAMLVSLIVIAATIAPWTIRNAQVFGHFVPMSTSDGVNLWMGNNAGSDGSYSPLPLTVQGLNEYEQNRILSEDALLFVSEHPLMFVCAHVQESGVTPYFRNDGYYLEYGGHQTDFRRKRSLSAQIGDARLLDGRAVTCICWHRRIDEAQRRSARDDKSSVVDLDLFHGGLFDICGGRSLPLPVSPFHFHAGSFGNH